MIVSNRHRSLPVLVCKSLVRLAFVVGTTSAMLFLFRNYYGPNGLLFGDFNPPWTQDLLSAALSQILHSWNPYFGGGSSSIILNATTFAPLMVQAALRAFGIALSTELVYPLVFTVAYCGCFILLRRLGTSRFAAILASVLYIGNPWILDRILLGHSAILVAVAIVPWMLATCTPGRAFHLLGLLSVLTAAAELQSDVRIAYLLFVGLYIIVIVRVAISTMGKGVPALLSALRAPSVIYTLLTPFLAFALNAWWTIPFLLFKDINPVRPFYPPLEEVATYSSQGDIAHDFVLSGNFLHYSWTSIYQLGVLAFICWYAAFIIIIALALYAPGLPAARRLIVRLTVLAGLLLSTGTKYFPREAVYWFYLHVPFAAFFRDPNKFSFVVSLGLVVGVGSAWAKLGRLPRLFAFASICMICLPLSSGHFQARLDPQYESFAEPGMQEFSERPHFVRLLNYLRSQRDFPNFRVAVIPPWLSEQSLRSGTWYVTNPFVFQLEIPTIDAKLVSTGTATNQAAWRAFDALYWGVDRHPGATFARLGIHYFVVLDKAVVSLGAGQSPFFGVPVDRVVTALLQDRAIHEVLRDGPYHIYINDRYIPIIRTAALPLVSGDVPDELRTALPAEEIGDSIAAPEHRQLAFPQGTVPIGQTPLDRCIGSSPLAVQYSAYLRVSQMENWFEFWSASDYSQSGTGDPLFDRKLERFTEPFALTLSLRTLTIPVVAHARSHVFVQVAGVTDSTIVSASIDGGRIVTWVPSSLGFSWHEIGSVGQGAHVVALTGSTIGTAVKNVAVAPAACNAGGISFGPSSAVKGRVYFVPGPMELVKVSRAPSQWRLSSPGTPIRVDGQQRLVSGTTQSGLLSPGVRAFTWDGKPIREGVPFLTLSGVHTLRGFSFHGLNGATAPRRVGQSIVSDVGGAVPGKPLAVQVHSRYDKKLTCVIVDGGRSTILVVTGSITETVLITPESRRVEIYVVGLPLRVGPPPVDIREYPVYEASRSSVFLPASAIRLPDDAYSTIEPTMGSSVELQFKDDHASLEIRGPDETTFVEDTEGRFSHLRIAGAHSRRTQRDVVTVYYRTFTGDVAQRSVAEFVSTPRRENLDLPIPSLPNMSALAIAIRQPDGERTVLSSDSIELTAGPRVDAGYFVSIPSNIRRRSADSVNIISQEYTQFSVEAKQRSAIVGNFSYDDRWVAPYSNHYVANGTGNLWDGSSNMSASYTIQPFYKRLLLISAALWILLSSMIVTLYISTYLRRAK